MVLFNIVFFIPTRITTVPIIFYMNENKILIDHMVFISINRTIKKRV